MKTTIKNFLSLFRRFTMATLLNVAGLSVAFAACLIIMMQVHFDLGFNQSISHADHIFRVERIGDGKRQTINFRPFSEMFIQSSPHILAGGFGSFGITSDRHSAFWVEQNGGQQYYNEKFCNISPGYTRVFSFEMLEGSEESLQEPGKIIIPQSIATKLFGKNPAVNRQLTGEDFIWTVGGVYKDFPANTSVSNIIYAPLDPGENKDNWRNSNYHLYVRLDNPDAAKGLMEQFIHTTQFPDQLTEHSYVLTPLREIHFDMHTEFDTTPKTARLTLLILIAIALIILVIATINYTNYSIALTPMRIKSVNTQKVLGASETALRSTLHLEAVILCFLAWLISLGLVYILSLTSFSSLIDPDISLPNHFFLVLGTGLISLAVGFFAGIYPSRYITSFSPALALKGNFGLSPKGRTLRSSLIGIQFTGAFVLIICVLFMYLQNHYMQDVSPGYEKEQIIITDLNKKINDNQDAFINNLLKFPAIEDVALADCVISGSDDYMTWGINTKDKYLNFQAIPVSYNFLKMMGIEIYEGRDFSKSDISSSIYPFIFTEYAAKKFDLELGETMWEGAPIIGFSRDIRIMSMRKLAEPIAFSMVEQYNQPKYAYIKTKPGVNLSTTIQQVRSVLNDLSPDYPFDIRFYDEIIQQLYIKEKNFASLTAWFSGIAIFLSIIGVFGLVIFECEYRRKEIGIRKVLGSSTREILEMINSHYLLILCICFVIAIPLSWYGTSQWLESFAYKIPLYWWVFAFAFLLIITITVATVTFQSWKVANTNPVNSLRTD